MKALRHFTTLALLLLATLSAGAPNDTITRSERLFVDVSADGRIVIEVAGSPWVVPLGGGEADKIDVGSLPVQGPRWSPDASQIIYAAATNGTQSLWLHNLLTSETRAISQASSFDMHPAWHPDGERVIYASQRRDTGLDLWEVDLPTGLHWRLSSRPGDETDPAWSADGRHLVYVHKNNEAWSLVLRRLGEAEEILVVSEERIFGPSWRPDGSLITYWQDSSEGTSLDMVILSEPRLVRRYMDGEDYLPAPVSWLDKHRMFYAAGGVVRQRLFNSWSSRTVPFRVTLAKKPDVVVAVERRTLPRTNEPRGKFIIHATRMYDGLGGGYRRNQDIVIDGGRIAAVADHADHAESIVIDMGDLAVMPGFVDVQARLPENTDESAGPLLLAAGVTTLVAAHPNAEHLHTIWSGKELPGPRLLPASDWSVENYSGLADSMTPGIDDVRQSRVARLTGYDEVIARRFTEPPVIDTGFTAMVLGSRPNGMPAGLGLHAELNALVAAGLTPEQALRAAGVNAAAALRVDPKLGRLATGAVADLIFVDGNPLERIGDALNVVAVVRNGRFFSVAGLIDRTSAAKTVE